MSEPVTHNDIFQFSDRNKHATDKRVTSRIGIYYHCYCEPTEKKLSWVGDTLQANGFVFTNFNSFEKKKRGGFQLQWYIFHHFSTDVNSS